MVNHIMKILFLLKLCGGEVLQDLLSLYNEAFTVGYLPIQLYGGGVVLIPKSRQTLQTTCQLCCSL